MAGDRTTPNLTSPVILNSFQDPSRPKRGAVRIKAESATWCANQHSAPNEKWILKQVQDDDFGKVRA